jgi:hypothetical protein
MSVTLAAMVQDEVLDDLDSNIVGLIPAQGMDVFLVFLLYVVLSRDRSCDGLTPSSDSHKENRPMFSKSRKTIGKREQQ